MKTKILVKYYKLIEDITKVNNETLLFSGDVLLIDVLNYLAKKYGRKLQDVLFEENNLSEHVRIFINDELIITSSDRVLTNGDELAIFLAVAGG